MNYKCIYCNDHGHKITNCQVKPKLNILDPMVSDLLSTLPGVYRVFSTIELVKGIPKLIYKVYMDTRKIDKNDNKFNILKDETVVVVHSGKFQNVLDNF